MEKGKYMADSNFALSKWETALLGNDVSHWLGSSLESVRKYIQHAKGFNDEVLVGIKF